MKQYESYKPSGTPWIGDIPSHWVVVPLKYLCSSERYAIKTGPFGSQLKGDDLLEEGDVRVYSQRNVIDCQFAETRFFISQSKAKELESFYTKEGDILLTSRGTIGRAAILPKNSQPGILHPCLIAVRINRRKIDDIWLTLWLNEGDLFKTQISLASNATTIEVIYTDTLKNILVPLPPLDEQISIRNYINKKCESIDKVIATQERRIELLTELKQSIITEAVTRGLNPNVPLKDSGIDWIGQIPEHWKKCRFKNFIDLVTTPSASDNKIGLENIESCSGKFIETFSEFDGTGTFFKVGHIVYGKLRPYLRKVWIAEFDGNAVGDFFVFEAKPNTISSFVKYLLLSDGFTQIATGSTEGAKMPRVSSETILSLSYCLPTLEEQCAIVNYLDKKCARIDSAISKAKREIELLREFKQSVITEAVTGKIKVY